MSAVGASLAEQMKATPIFEGYGHPDQFPLFLDRMGELMRKDWDWREEVPGPEVVHVIERFLTQPTSQATQNFRPRPTLPPWLRWLPENTPS